jgi:hypothetical protein
MNRRAFMTYEDRGEADLVPKRGQAPLCEAPSGPFRQRLVQKGVRHRCAKHPPGRSGNAWFKKGSGTVVRSTLRAVPATVPDPFLNQAAFQRSSTTS